MKMVSQKKMKIGKHYMIAIDAVCRKESFIKLLEDDFRAYASYTVYEYYSRFGHGGKNIMGRGRYHKNICDLDDIFELTDDEVRDLIVMEII